MSLVVFTAVIGQTEPLQAPNVVNPNVRYLCFSDQSCDVPPYEWIRVTSKREPRWVSRRIKILAEHAALRGATETLWHDASYRLLRDPVWVSRRLMQAEIVALRSTRASLEHEAVRIARYGYVTEAQAALTIDRYHAAGFEGRCLSAGGLLGRRVTPAVRNFNRLWWQESQGEWGGR